MTFAARRSSLLLWQHHVSLFCFWDLIKVRNSSCYALFTALLTKPGVMGSIIGADNAFSRYFNIPDADMQGNITALYDIGCVLGSIITYFIGERFGTST